MTPDYRREAPEKMAEELPEVKMRPYLFESFEHRITEELQKAVDNEDVFELTDDEVRMLKAYRSCTKDVFKWRNQLEKIIIPKEPTLLVDANDIS